MPSWLRKRFVKRRLPAVEMLWISKSRTLKEYIHISRESESLTAYVLSVNYLYFICNGAGLEVVVVEETGHAVVVVVGDDGGGLPFHLVHGVLGSISPVGHAEEG